MKPMTNGTRRSSYPLSHMLNNQKQHEQKLDKYYKVGYRLVKNNGFTSILAYHPYNRSYVKLVEVENGKTKNTIQMTKKELKALIKNFESTESTQAKPVAE